MSIINDELVQFSDMLTEIMSEVSLSRAQEIRAAAITCWDLMNYSWEVVDVQDPDWIQLTHILHQILSLTT